MKKYGFVLLAAAVLFSGCENRSGSREYVEFEVPYLTTMTMTTTVPVDTYSEYMETYTPTESETFDSNRFYYQGGAHGGGAQMGIGYQANGVYADTMATVPRVSAVSGITADTPMTTTVTTVTESGSDDPSTETVTTEVSEPEDASETVTASAQTTPGISMDTMATNRGVSAGRAADTGHVDTAFSNNVTGYTGTMPDVAPDTMYKNTTANGGNG